MSNVCGIGSFGYVYRLPNLNAEKKTNIFDNPANNSLSPQNLVEVNVAYMLHQSPLEYVCEVQSVVSTHTEYSIEMNYYPYTLKNYPNPIDFSKCIYQILCGLKNLHTMVLCHGDLKSDNIMITSDGDVRIIDFSSSVIDEMPFNENSTGCCHIYAAPELFDGYYSTRVEKYHIGPYNDVWSVGIVILEFLNGINPFQSLEGNYSSHSEVDWILNGRINSSDEYFDKYYRQHPEWSSFLKDVLVRDHTRRPTPSQLIEKYWPGPAKSVCLDRHHDLMSVKVTIKKDFQSIRKKILKKSISNLSSTYLYYVPCAVMLFDRVAYKYKDGFNANLDMLARACLILSMSANACIANITFEPECASMISTVLRLCDCLVYTPTLLNVIRPERYHNADIVKICDISIRHKFDDDAAISVRDLISYQEKRYDKWVAKRVKKIQG